MNNKGIYLTVEALISFLLFVSLLLMAVPVQQESFSELIVMQKTHDVLKVWNMQKGSESNLTDLMAMAFPNNDFDIEFDDSITGTASKGNSYVTSAYIYNQGQLKKVHITVHF